MFKKLYQAYTTVHNLQQVEHVENKPSEIKHFLNNFTRVSRMLRSYKI